MPPAHFQPDRGDPESVELVRFNQGYDYGGVPAGNAVEVGGEVARMVAGLPGLLLAGREGDADHPGADGQLRNLQEVVGGGQQAGHRSSPCLN